MKHLIALLALSASFLQAAPISGTAYPSITDELETFDSATPGLYTSFTSGVFTLTGLDGQFTISDAYIGQYNTRGLQSVSNGGDFLQFRFDFAGGVSAFTFNWGAADHNWDLKIYDASDTLMEWIIIDKNAPNDPDYFGATGENISYATLIAPAGDHVFIDNVSWISVSTAVPDSASTLGLCGMGLAALTFLRRRITS